jgi:hypothetical protein
MDGTDQPHGRRVVDLIDLDDERNVTQWTEIFDITYDELAEAVHAVGNASRVVKCYVRERKYGKNR